jgi:glycosyltransferase involved in cell wall biosynthesis
MVYALPASLWVTWTKRMLAALIPHFMANPFFSTIIPVYNRASLVMSAIDSALSQSMPEQEVIIVDDGSTDDTVSVLQKRYGDCVRLLQQPNSGPGPARNKGIEVARGRYVACLDSDDCWFPWTLATYRRGIEQYAEPAFITGQHRVFRDAQELANLTETALDVEVFADYFASNDRWRWWGASSFVVRRDVLVAAGGFANSQMNAEDADLAMRLGVSPGFVHVQRPKTFGYREHDANVRRDLSRTLSGLQYQVEAEENGRYPGGAARRAERIRILGGFVRPVVFALLQSGDHRAAWNLYRRTFRWHLRLRRLRFLLGFPIIASLKHGSVADPVMK